MGGGGGGQAIFVLAPSMEPQPQRSQLWLIFLAVSVTQGLGGQKEGRGPWCSLAYFPPTQRDSQRVFPSWRPGRRLSSLFGERPVSERPGVAGLASPWISPAGCQGRARPARDTPRARPWCWGLGICGPVAAAPPGGKREWRQDGSLSWLGKPHMFPAENSCSGYVHATV